MAQVFQVEHNLVHTRLVEYSRCPRGIVIVYSQFELPWQVVHINTHRRCTGVVVRCRGRSRQVEGLVCTERGGVASQLFATVDHLVQVQVDADLRDGVGWYAVDDSHLSNTHMLTAEVVVQLYEL